MELLFIAVEAPQVVLVGKAQASYNLVVMS